MQFQLPPVSRVQPVPDPVNPLVAAGQALGLRQQQQQLALGKQALAEGAVKKAQIEQDAQDEADTRQAFNEAANGGDPAAAKDQALSILNTRNPRAWLKASQQLAAIAKTNAENTKQEVENSIKHAAQIGQAVQGVSDQKSYDVFRGLHPDIAGKLPADHASAKPYLDQLLSEGTAIAEMQTKAKEASAASIAAAKAADDHLTAVAAGNKSVAELAKLQQDVSDAQQKEIATHISLADTPEKLAAQQDYLINQRHIPAAMVQAVPDKASADAILTPRQAPARPEPARSPERMEQDQQLEQMRLNAAAKSRIPSEYEQEMKAWLARPENAGKDAEDFRQSKISDGDNAFGRKEVAKALETRNGAVALKRSMQDALERIKSGKSMAVGADDMILLSNHIAMTMGQVKGARSGKQIIDEHRQARDLPSELQVLVDGWREGSRLSPGQREEFLATAQNRVSGYEKDYAQSKQDWNYIPPGERTISTPASPAGGWKIERIEAPKK